MKTKHGKNIKTSLDNCNKNMKQKQKKLTC